MTIYLLQKKQDSNLLLTYYQFTQSLISLLTFK